MKFIKRLLALLFLLLFVGLGITYYAFKIEPYQVKTANYDVNQATSTSTPLKIVQISDTHIKEDFTVKNLTKVIDKINTQNPDIVVFTGDLYDNYANYNDDEALINQLSNIKTKYAKIAIWGNHDHGGGARRDYSYIMQDAGFTVLQNEDKVVTVDNGKKILFTGLDDSLLSNSDISQTGVDKEADYSILLSHEPDVIEQHLNYNYDLTMSGHSHGGQINIPFIPKVNDVATSTTDLASIYNRGLYDTDGKGVKKIFVSTGIGTTHISARFGVKPEVSVLKINV